MVIAIIAELVPRFAFIYIRANNPIATPSNLAAVGTGVGVDIITVIASFVAQSFWVVDIGSPDAVTALCIFAGVGAGIVIVAVSVVTRFTGGGDAVSAAGESAIAIAATAVGVDTVVTGFKPFNTAVSTNREVRVGAIRWTFGVEWVIAIFSGINDAISTVSDLAIGSTSVDFIVGVQGAVVAGFVASDYAIAASTFAAVVVTAIAVDAVLVIAFFKTSNNTIPTIGQSRIRTIFRARGWAVGCQWVAILRCVLNSVAAEGEAAIHTATVGICGGIGVAGA